MITVADLPMITVAAVEGMTIGAEATITGLPGEAPAAGDVVHLPTTIRARGAAIPTAHGAEGVAHSFAVEAEVVVVVVVVEAVAAVVVAERGRAFRESPCWCATSGPTSPTTTLVWRLGASVRSAMSTSRGITTRSKRKALPLSSMPIPIVSKLHTTAVHF
jgi:hypothetical protein